MIRERTIEGVKAARAKGRMGNRPPADRKTIKTALELYHSRACLVDTILKTTGISKGTLYNTIHLSNKNVLKHAVGNIKAECLTNLLLWIIFARATFSLFAE